MTEPLRKAFRRIIIHAGTEKTGTTSLQSFFTINRERLIEQGFYYPSSLTSETMVKSNSWNHIYATLIGFEVGAMPRDLVQIAGIFDRQSVFHSEVRASFEREIKSLPPGQLDLVIISEHLHSRITSKEQLEKIKLFFEPYCDDFVVIVYLRSQLALARSVGGMAIRAGKAVDSSLPTLTFKSSFDKKWGVGYGYFDYFSYLARIESTFGFDKTTVRLYVEDSARNGFNKWNVIEDFLQCLGISDFDFVYPEYENRNISDEALRFLSSINESISKFPDETQSSIRARIIRSLHKNFPGHGVVPTRSEAMSFMKIFNLPNKVIQAKYFPNKPELFGVIYEEFPGIKMRSDIDSSFLDIICTVLESSIPAAEYAGKFRSFIPSNDLDIKLYQSGLISLLNVQRPADGVYRASIEPDVESIRIVSKSGRSRVAEDPRVLGVCIRKIVIGGSEIPMDSDHFGEGFYPVEVHGEQMWRWTSGDAILRISPRIEKQDAEIHIANWHITLTNYS